MRPFFLVLLLAAATSAAAATTPYSIDFVYPQVGVMQEDYSPAPLRATGTWPGNVAIRVYWSYTIETYPTITGQIDFRQETTDTVFGIAGPKTSNYVGTLHGTASITYQLPDAAPVTKTIPLLVYDYFWVLMFGERVLESDPPMHTLPFRMTKPTTVPLTLKLTTENASAGASDYALVDSAITIPPGANSGEIRFTIAQDNVAEPQETFYIHARLYDGATYISGNIARIDITEREIRASFVPDQLNVFAGDPFSLTLVLSEKLVMPPAWPPPVVSFATTNPAAVATLPPPLPISDKINLGTIEATAGGGGDAIVTAEFPDAASVAPAAAHIHVYGGVLSFGETKFPLVIAPGQTIVVPVQMTPPPPAPFEFFATEERLAGFVDVQTSLMIDSGGKGSLSVTGKKAGSSIVEIDTLARRHVSGFEVLVKTPAPPPPPPPSRKRSVRH